MSLPETKVRTCWWFGGDGRDAAMLYVALIPHSRIERVVERDGVPLVIELTLAGTPMMILNAAPGAERTHAASISVSTEDQAETDRLWAALTADGGAEVACGWLTDRWGVSWQIVPRRLPEMLASDDRAAAERAFAAMQRMVKIDIAALEAAYRA
ncbi:VOC family protein [Salinarimonas sp. NSM]|uniref:VOC family protein n=1 Tax=Salinarimonas sp. NSM TaxID=3458003 RepID=UPI0040375DD0